MYKVTVRNNQSIWDLANQEYGSGEGAYQICVDNPGVVDFENKIPAGTVLNFDEAKVLNQVVVDLFKSKKIRPTTAVDIADDTDEHEDSIVLQTGGYMTLQGGGSILLR